MLDSSQQALDKVAAALLARPGLKLTVTGAADPATERTAMRQALLDDRLQAERAREPLRAAATLPTRLASASASAMATAAPSQAPPLPSLTPEERAQLLKALYQKTALPNKPRNAFGLLRGDLPAAEIEALLLAALPVGDDTARDLALQRGLAVRDALVARRLPSERLFLAAPQLHVATDTGTVWTPQVNLSLSSH